MKSVRGSSLSILRRVAAGLFITVAAGCGGDELDFADGGETEVRDISFQDDQISRGDATVAFFEFNFDKFDVSEGDDVYVTVRLPAGVRFRVDSAEIDGAFGDDDGVSPAIVRCANTDETFLYFTLDDDDLDDADSGSTDATLTLTVDGVQRGTGLVAASASRAFGLPSCFEAFDAEEAETLTVF